MMNKIDGDGRTIRELLSGKKYSIDYYQREYKWERKQIQELIDDLTGSFLEDHDPGDERFEVEKYGHYFLGSIIVSHKDNTSFVIDGQQRLTSLTLLLIYLHNLQRNRSDEVKLHDLIFSERFARKSFNLDVEERTPVMEALFDGKTYDATGQSESVQRINARYDDIEELFPGQLKGPSLPYFVDWLTENVHLVEIAALSDEDAYTIFETMNDRGLSLSPTEMLKGFLLANISDPQKRAVANKFWKECIEELAKFDKDADADFLKAWLRSQYSTSIRERKRGATPQDFDRIGSEFHRWVRDNEERLGLANSAAFHAFVLKDMFYFYSKYLRILQASQSVVRGLEAVCYNAQNGFTLQYSLLLAPLTPADDEATADKKMALVATFLDILLTRRMWNFRSNDYNTMQYAAFIVMRDARHKSLAELAELLIAKLADDKEVFSSNERFSLHGMNRKQIHRILARMTDYVEVQSGLQSHYMEYLGGRGNGRYEVEHIWANKPERHKEEFANEHDFVEYRNRIGGLLLLPKGFNGSYGALPYAEKLPHYFGQNLLAKSLHTDCYQHNPGFLSFAQRTGLAFQAHPEFKKSDLDARQELYLKLAEKVWSPDRLRQIVSEGREA